MGEGWKIGRFAVSLGGCLAPLSLPCTWLYRDHRESPMALLRPAQPRGTEPTNKTHPLGMRAEENMSRRRRSPARWTWKDVWTHDASAVLFRADARECARRTHSPCARWTHSGALRTHPCTWRTHACVQYMSQDRTGATTCSRQPGLARTLLHRASLRDDMVQTTSRMKKERTTPL